MVQTKIVNMERQYRYPVLVGTKGKANKLKGIVKFMVGWQLIGYLMYRYMTGKVRKKDPDGPEVFDKRPFSEKLQLMHGKNIEPVKTKILLTPSGIQKETYVDNNTKETYKLTMKGFKQIEEDKVDSQSFLSNDKTDTPEEVPVDKPIPKTVDPPQGYTRPFYQSISSVSTSLFNWGGSKNKKIDDS